MRITPLPHCRRGICLPRPVQKSFFPVQVNSQFPLLCRYVERNATACPKLVPSGKRNGVGGSLFRWVQPSELCHDCCPHGPLARSANWVPPCQRRGSRTRNSMRFRWSIRRGIRWNAKIGWSRSPASAGPRIHTPAGTRTPEKEAQYQAINEKKES